MNLVLIYALILIAPIPITWVAIKLGRDALASEYADMIKSTPIVRV